MQRRKNTDFFTQVTIIPKAKYILKIPDLYLGRRLSAQRTCCLWYRKNRLFNLGVFHLSRSKTQQRIEEWNGWGKGRSIKFLIRLFPTSVVVLPLSSTHLKYTQMRIADLRLKWFFVGGGLISLLTGLFLIHQPVLLALGDVLVVEDKLKPADLIHILGGGFDRLDYGLQLYTQGYGQRIFITGGDDAIAYRAYALTNGAQAKHILPTDSWAINTYQEALELKQFLDSESSIQSVIVVSSPYHMRRAQWTFQDVLGDQVALQFAPVPFAMARHKQQWWVDAGSRKIVVGEYFKLLFYYVDHNVL
jgi:uncharacterized SAM-binding protein YcdF (DUF218 family)